MASYGEKVSQLQLALSKQQGPVRTRHRTDWKGGSATMTPKQRHSRANNILQSKQTLRAFRKANGLRADGMVRPETRVFFDRVTTSTTLQDHAFFAQVPNMCLRRVSPEKVQHLCHMENKVRSLFSDTAAVPHRYGANGGVNIGISVVDGGSHARGGKSGSIHYSDCMKSYPQLRNDIISLLGSILDEAFGDLLWYKNSKAVCAKLNQDSREKRTLPGMPSSGIWLSTAPKAEKIHCDGNVAGPTFLLSTYPAAPGTAALCTMSPGREPTQTTMSPGMVLGGKWASNAHCNTRLDKAAVTKRTSWTIYLDKRVFGCNYKFVAPNRCAAEHVYY